MTAQTGKGQQVAPHTTVIVPSRTHRIYTGCVVLWCNPDGGWYIAREGEPCRRFQKHYRRSGLALEEIGAHNDPSAASASVGAAPAASSPADAGRGSAAASSPECTRPIGRPWTVTYERGSEWHIVDGETFRTVAKVGNPLSMPYKSDEQDAHLIAAAPALLEALREIMETWDDYREQPEDYFGLMDKAAEQARAAIKIAEGGE